MEGLTHHPVIREGLRLSCAAGPGTGARAYFQHGLCGDCGQTMEVFPHDAAAMRTLECRGHGRSDAGDPRHYAIATFAEDLAALMERDGAPSILGGISMGAAIAARLAVTRPDLVRALILARPAWIAAAAPANMAPNAEVARWLARPGRPGEAAAFRASATGRRLADEAPDNLASLCGFFARRPRDVTAALLAAISTDGPRVDESALAGLRLPVLVIGTAEDLIHPISIARRLARLIPGARLVEIAPKGRGRDVHRQAFRAALGHFMETLADA